MDLLLFTFDVVLLLGLTLRLTLFVVGDDLGQMWVVEPATRWAMARPTVEGRKKAIRYVDGLTCPFCVGFWIGVACTVSLWAVGGPGHAEDLWRWVAAAFTLNYIVGHVSARLD